MRQEARAVARASPRSKECMRERKEKSRSRDKRTKNVAPVVERVDRETVLPVIQEELVVFNERHLTGVVRAETHVESEEKTVDIPLHRDEVDVQREARNEVLAAPLEPWYEGDTLVLPVMEEVVVVQKQVVLKELVRITRKRSETIEQKRVTLRRQRVDVTREPAREDDGT